MSDDAMSSVVEAASHGVADTLALGRRLAGLLRPGDILLLDGTLGSGKTVFAAGVAEGLGVEEAVISPSFVLARTYAGFVPLVHADAYRLRTFGELEDLGLEEEARDGVLMVEWGSAVEDSLGDDHLMIEIEVAGPESRVLRFKPSGSWTKRPLGEMGA